MKRSLAPHLIVALILLGCALVTSTAVPATPTPEPTLAASTATFAAPSTAEPVTASPTATPEAKRGEIARRHIEFITQEIGAREAGTESEARTAQYIKKSLNELGYKTGIQPFSQIGWVGEDEVETMINSANIIGFKQGDSKERIIVGAHYDSCGEGLGADDNASGVAVILELAERLKDYPTPYTIYFMAFGAEEVGLLGSDFYVETMSAQDRQNTVAMINLDSVVAGDFAYAYSGEGSQAVLRDWALEWATQNGFDLQTISNVDLYDEEGYGTSDFAAFDQAGIPFVYFESTNWTLGDQDGYTQVDVKYGDQGSIFHTEFDRLDYFDEVFPGRVDERLESVTSIVEAILTQFEFPD